MPSTKSYNQALVVQDGIIQFVPMNTTDTFIARDTIDLKRVQTLLGKIIEQELDFLAQLNSFKDLLQSAGVISKDKAVEKYKFQMAKCRPAKFKWKYPYL